MEKLINVLIIGRVPIICLAIENVISKNFTESFVMISRHMSEIVDLNDIVSFNIIIIDGDDYSKDELITFIEIKKIATSSKIIIFSFNEDMTYIHWCFKNGANSYLSKYAKEDNIVRSINLTLNGNNYFINDLKIRVPSPQIIKESKLLVVNFKPLSTREFEIAKLLSKGCKNKFISNKLNITESTVSTYKKRILIKTNSSNVFELINKLNKSI